MKQPTFDYRVVVVLRWKCGWLVARWNTGIRAVMFRTWLEAMAVLCQPLNHMTVIKVRP